MTPLQLTLANMAIANDGYLLKPQLVYMIGDSIVAERQVRREVAMDKDILQIVREGMRQVLTDGTTCECTFSDTPVEVAGKSGTAQTTSDETRRPHAWYTAICTVAGSRNSRYGDDRRRVGRLNVQRSSY